VTVNRLDRIQLISKTLRYVLLGLAVAVCGAIVFMLLSPDQSWVTLGNGQLNELYRTGDVGPLLMFAISAPITLLLALGIYWLQRLFGEYQHGQFFTDGTMRCYVWLVWLKAAGFVYGILWPVLLISLDPSQTATDAGVTIEAGTLVELTVLLLIVYLLREAQRLHDENEAFI
jgi:hypothetical protein